MFQFSSLFQILWRIEFCALNFTYLSTGIVDPVLCQSVVKNFLDNPLVSKQKANHFAAGLVV
jgi:hypothetical protein